MSKVRIRGNIKKLINGIVYNAEINMTMPVDIISLDFDDSLTESRKKGKHQSADRNLLFPRNMSALSELQKIFPPDEWEYTFYTYAMWELTMDPDRPHLLALLNPVNGGDPVRLDFDDVTEKEYEYLRGLYSTLFPEAYFMTRERYYNRQLDAYLLPDGDFELSIGSGLSDLIWRMKDEDYMVLRQMFYDMKNEYMDDSSVYINIEKLNELINREILNGLMEMARKRKSEKAGE